VLSYDNTFRDENTGSLGVDFNRRDWPGSPDAGFYKPHSMLWVCPPGVCPITPQITPRSVVDGTATQVKRKVSRKAGGQKLAGRRKTTSQRRAAAPA
jgi:hypothetical protein